MSQLHIEFVNLKKNIIKKYGTSINIEKIKESFVYIINSRRSLSRVKNLSDILQLLEQYDILDHDNIAVLEYLANLFKNEEVSNLIRGYKKLYIDSDPVCNCGEDLSFSLPLVNPLSVVPVENQSNSK